MNLPHNTDAFLDALSQASLQDLSRRIQKRLHPKKTASHNFKLGDQVTFSYKGVTHFGTVIRINQKTISVVQNGDDQGTWKISPSLLAPLRSAHS